MKIMVHKNSDRPITSLNHEGKEYKPNADGAFEVDDAHVAALRSHGLILEGEPADPVAAEKQRRDLAAENDELKARIATLEGRVADLESKKKGKAADA